jgi:uncharacterized protein (UPF0335 family)
MSEDNIVIPEGINGGHLKAFVERIETLEDDRLAIVEDIKSIYQEAKANGYDTAILRQVIKIRKQDRYKRIEAETILELYLNALGE